MNPEFLRNVWLELTPRRMAIMAVLLGLVFLASESSGQLTSPAAAGQTLFYLIVLLWGTRNAALSVVGEIRERTWDSQRLSAIGPAAMTIGKLLGSTIYNWFGGAICLAVIFISTVTSKDASSAVLECFRLIALGALAQTASLLASLIAIRRRQGAHSRLDIFIYQIVGLAAAGAFQLVWGTANLPGGSQKLETIAWWGAEYAARPFLLVSLAIFVGWMFVACYRQMRVELQTVNGPLVWLAFAVFVAVYAGGFAPHIAGMSNPALPHLCLAAGSLGLLTYASVLLEPKDRVLYRWLRAAWNARNFAGAFSRVQGWMTSYVLFIAAALCLLIQSPEWSGDVGRADILAVCGFLTRDIGIVLWFAAGRTRRRGDWAAVFTLLAIYLLIPAVVSGASKDFVSLFRPEQGAAPWIAVAAAWVESIAVWGFALYRFSVEEDRAHSPSLLPAR